MSLLALLLTGCPVTVTCEDTGCRASQECNVTTGECEEKSRDCRERDICRRGEVCDDATGQCRPEQLRCTESFTCPEGQACNATSGFCERAAVCTGDADCAVAERCNLTSQACEPRRCDRDDACPTGHVCDDLGLCAAGCRPDQQGCGDGEFCFVIAGDTLGRCVPNCRRDRDCPFGQVCNLAAEEARCVREPPCTTDATCRTDEVCSEGVCGQPPCASDDDCLMTQVCEVASRTCRAGDCDEDNFGVGDAPNHTRATAAALDYGSYTQLMLCPGRSDWFALDVAGTDLVQVRMAQHSPDDDFDLFVYDQHGVLLVQNQQTGQVSTVRLAAGRAQTLFIEVRSVVFTGGSYDLTTSREVCPNDSFEENDSRAEATVVPGTLGVPSVLSLRACGFDEDWFSIRHTDASHGLQVQRLVSTADLRVDVFTPDGEQHVVRSDVPLLVRRIGVVGTTFVRAVGALGQSGEYRLGFEVVDTWSCEVPHLYATAETSRDLPRSEPLTAEFCPSDGAWEVSWLKLVDVAPGTLDFELRATDAPELDVALFRGDAASPTLVRNATRLHGAYRIQAAVDDSTTWYVRVAANASPQTIVDAPTYTATFDVR